MTINKINKVKFLLSECESTLIAMGDSTRLSIIQLMLELDRDCNGICVADITKNSNLSRPAISHHLKILKNSGVVTVREKGTKNYYYLASNKKSLKNLEELIKIIMSLVK
ncbi:MAG: metalloregulator ArsR/SmtB family transcription factor [Streptococcus sp.]|nr:metalloregulator ArsR/SmtB family transcription factor [Streptococcus sp.]